jgi:hypothetical protein
MKNSSSAVRRVLIQTGNSALILLVAIAIALLTFHQFGLINAWQFPIKPIAAFLGSGGLACFALAEFSTQRGQKQLLRALLVAFIALNAIAYLGAYALTHYKEPAQSGFGFPKPQNTRLPSSVGLEYISQRIPVNSTEWLETWFIPVRHSTPQGTILLFPANGGNKAHQLLAPAPRVSWLKL